MSVGRYANTEMSEHAWVDTGAGTGACGRIVDRYRVFQCAKCGQQVWHFYDITLSVTLAARLEDVPARCRRGELRLVTHRQVQLYMAWEERDKRRKRWWRR